MLARAATVAIAILAVPPTALAAQQPVSFARQVAPLLVAACGKCHVAGAKGGFQMSSHEALMKSGMVQRGAGDASRLVEVIASGDMPRGGGRVAPVDLAALVRWIDAGAPCDADPSARLDAVARGGGAAAVGAAASVPRERRAPRPEAELAAARGAAAAAAWRRALPDEEPVVELRAGLTVMGNLPQARLNPFVAMAVEVAERVRADVVGGDHRLLDEGMILFVFRNSYDYSAFWQEVVDAERPRGVSAHAGRTGDAVYAAMLVPADDPDDANTRLLLAEQIGAAAFLGRGTPGWFARGAGRAVASRLYSRAGLAQDWKRDVPAATRAVGSGADFLGGRADPAASAVAAGGFVAALASTSAKLKPLVAALDGGTSFDVAFAAAFRGTPEQLYEGWAAKQVRRQAPAR